MSVSAALGQEASRIAVEVHRGPEAFRTLLGDWQDLFHRSEALPFLSPEWLEPWWAILAPERQPVFLTVREGGRLIGLLALCEEVVRPFGARRLSFLGERWAGADYLDVLAEKGRFEEVAELLVDRIAALQFDVLDLDGLDSRSPSIPILQRRLGDGLEVTKRFVCPGVELEGGWQKVLANSKRADNFKRRLRQLKEVPGFEFRVVSDPSEARAAFDRFLVLHEKRWSSQGGSDAMGRPVLQDFHREAVERLAAAGLLRFEELWAEGGCRASIYGIGAGSTWSFYQSGYDPAWARRSVGLVVLGLSLEAAVSRGVSVYDFLRGTETYKFDWATRSLETVRVRSIRRGGVGALFLLGERMESAARKGAHALLPGSGVEALRRVRRWRERMGSRKGGGR